MELKDTVEMMNSGDYKERFKAEYLQTKIRYEKLKTFNTKIEAAQRVQFSGPHVRNLNFTLTEPVHDCPFELLREQQAVMGEYLHLLELRAEIEKIDLFA